MTDARNFLLNTDYPMDKILSINEGSFSVDAAVSSLVTKRTTSTFTHGHGDYCLIAGIYSYGDGVWFPLGVNKVVVSGTPKFQTVEVSAYSTDTDIVIVATNHITTGYTISYKIELLAVS